MIKYDTIIFIGTYNISRSAIAETIFRDMAKELDIEIKSRGLVVLFPEPYNQKAEIIMYNHGLTPKESCAVPLTNEELNSRTLVLTTTFNCKLKIIEDFHFQENVYTIQEFVNEEEDIKDPYGEELDVYEVCYQDIYKAMKLVVEKLEEEDSTLNIEKNEG